MKLVLCLLLASLTGCIAADKPDPIPVQQAHLEKVMWKYQKRFGFQDVYIRLEVRRNDGLSMPHTWGLEGTDKTSGGELIQIMAQQDYPAAYPIKDRRKHQEVVVLHEMFHIFFTSQGVPGEFQDTIIDALLPIWMKRGN